MRAALAVVALLALAAPASAQTWSPPQALSDAKAFVGLPGLVVSRDGRALANWSFTEGGGNAIRAGESTASRAPGGTAFGKSRALVGRTDLARVEQATGPVAYGRDGAIVAITRPEAPARLSIRFGHTDGSFGDRRTIRSLEHDRIGDVALAANDDGAAALAWFDDRGVDTDRVYVSLRRPHHGFGKPRRLATGRIRRVAVAIGASGDVLVAWNSPGKNLTRFKPRGRDGFLAIERLRSEPAYFTDLRPVVTGNGRAAVAWSSQFASEGGDRGPVRFEVAVRPSGASRFRDARLLEELGPEADDHAIDAVEGDRGRIAVAWSGTDGANRRVKVAQFDAGLRFQAPQLVSPAGEDAYARDLAADAADGSLIAVWDAGFGGNAIGAALSGGGGTPFGPPETVTAGPRAREAAAAFDPRTHEPTVVFSSRPDGMTAFAQAAARTG